MRCSFGRKVPRQIGAIALTLFFLLSIMPPVLAQEVPVQTDGLMTLRQAMKSGVKLDVQGDGMNTTSVGLQLTNTSGNPVRVVIPANETLHPNLPGIQTMVITNDIFASINPGETALISIRTFCASPKSVPPPPQVTDGLNFSPSDYKDPATWAQISAIIAAGQQLDTVGAFKALFPADTAIEDFTKEEVNKEIKRRVVEYMQQNPTATPDDADQAVRKDEDNIKKICKDKVIQREKQLKTREITQLAIWHILGIQSGKPEDMVSPTSLTKDTLRGISEAMHRDKSLIAKYHATLDKKGNLIPDPSFKATVDKRSGDLFALVDLTVSRASSPGLTGVATLPKDDPCDTFCSVGERAFNQGDFTVAQELLTSAAKLAESFGEKDPRLSRSLNSLGRCYLNLTCYDQARAKLSRALDLRKAVVVDGKETKEVAEVESNLGTLALMQGNYASAANTFDTASSIFEKEIGKTSPEVASALNSKGQCQALSHKLEEGRETLNRAMSIAFINCPQDVAKTTLYTPFFAEIENNLGNVESMDAQYKMAQQLYQKALDIDTNTLGNEHPFLANILDGLSTVTSKLGQAGKAEEYKKQADGIRERSLETGSKDIGNIAALPLSTDDLGRLWRFIQGKKDFQYTIATLKAAPTTRAPKPKSDAVNRPIADKWALVIGISKFKDPTINLQYAAKDAKDFATYLTKEANFAPDHVRVLTNERATKAEIDRQLSQWLPKVIGKDDLVMIYFSSHGSPSSMDYASVNFLVTYDTDKTNLLGTAYGIDDFSKHIKQYTNKTDRVVLIMDACHSGAAVDAANGEKGIFLLNEHNVDSEKLSLGEGRVVICSSSADQTSWESNQYPNGVFTHWLLEGLRHSGKEAQLPEVFAFMKKHVETEVQDKRKHSQTPTWHNEWSGEDLIVGVKPAEPHPGVADDYKPPTAAPAAVTASKSVTAGGGGKAPASPAHKATPAISKQPAGKAKTAVH